METGINALTTVNTIEVGYNVNFSADVLAFTHSLERANEAQLARSIATDALTSSLIRPLNYIDGEAEALVEYARDAVASGKELTPSEIIMLTARSQEFMFHSQLTANIANRTAEGLQQLFRQQS